MSELARELDVARAAALEAGALILGHYRRGLRDHETKDDASPVTRADVDANAAIWGHLAAAFPDDGILSEEAPPRGGRPAGVWSEVSSRSLRRNRVKTPGKAEPTRVRSTRGRRVWVVDPLDGTRDFLERTGDFAVLIGLVDRGVPVLGVAHAPAHGGLWHATRGGGAWRDGARLRVSDREALADLRGAVGKTALPPHVLAFIDAAPFPVGRIGAGLKYLRLCEGELDAAFWLTPREKVWDTCATDLLCAEAGGVVTDLDGAPLRYDLQDLGRPRGVVASNGRRHGELLALARPFFRP